MNLEQIAITAAEKAAEKVLEIYHSQSLDLTYKEDDSPLTLADTLSNKIITEYLSQTQLPIVSEESNIAAYRARKHYELFWLIDPLDGTKEFVNRNGEFTINIALIKNEVPVFGVVHCPCQEKLFYGGAQKGVFIKKKNKTTSITPPKKSKVAKIAVSRSHLNQETLAYINRKEQSEIIRMGSSLKFMSIVEGKATIYPRFGPTMEWDVAASHAILKGIQIEVLDAELNTPLRYNKENLLNPHFIVEV